MKCPPILLALPGRASLSVLSGLCKASSASALHLEHSGYGLALLCCTSLHTLAAILSRLQSPEVAH